MSKNGKSKSALADPSRLRSSDKGDGDTLRVVIETPKGSRNKYAFDAKEKVFELKKVLPAGMDFPYDFGFVPSTTADDGDPVDVLVLMDEPAFTGCVLKCRIIGIIEGDRAIRKRLNETTAWSPSKNKTTAGLTSSTSTIWEGNFGRSLKNFSSTTTNSRAKSTVSSA